MPVVSPAAVASIVTEPARTPVIVLVATPLDAVALPAPLMVPRRTALAKAMTVELSEVTVLPAASWIVAVSTRVAPEVRSAVEPLSAIWAAAPWTTVNAPSVPVVNPAAVASIVTGPASAPVIVLVATPLDAVALPVPLTVPAPDAFANATTVELSAVTGVAGRVLDRGGEQARRAGGEVRGRSGERDLGRCAVDDGEGAEGAGGQSRGGRFHRYGAGEDAGDRLGGDAGGGGCVAGPGHRAGAGRLGERDHG